MSNIYYPNSFFISKKKSWQVLFFDIFFKNNYICFISPIYKDPFSENDIMISYKDVNLKFLNKVIKEEYEPTSIYKYRINTNKKKIKIRVKYLNSTKEFILEKKEETKNFLTLSTLFKDDYRLINIFYDYYKQQGVEHFYLYYNGKLNKEIIQLFNKIDITLIQWDFRYWITRGSGERRKIWKYRHHAQLGSLNHALYKYGKENSDYMIFNDLDEYFYIPDKTIFELLKKHNYDNLQFCNIWSTTLDLKTPDKFPLKFKRSNNKYKYKYRSKNIYKCESVKNIGIHECRYYERSDIEILSDLDMFHFFNWTVPGRKVEEEDKKENLELFSDVELNFN